MIARAVQYSEADHHYNYTQHKGWIQPQKAINSMPGDDFSVHAEKAHQCYEKSICDCTENIGQEKSGVKVDVVWSYFV